MSASAVSQCEPKTGIPLSGSFFGSVELNQCREKARFLTFGILKAWYPKTKGGHHGDILQESRAFLRRGCDGCSALRNARIGRTIGHIRYCIVC